MECVYLKYFWMNLDLRLVLTHHSVCICYVVSLHFLCLRTSKSLSLGEFDEQIIYRYIHALI